MKNTNKIKKCLNQNGVVFDCNRVYFFKKLKTKKLRVSREEISFTLDNGLYLEIINDSEKDFYNFFVYYNNKLLQSETFYQQQELVDFLQNNLATVA